MRVYQTFHVASGWTRGEVQDSNGLQNLRDVYRFTRRLAITPEFTGAKPAPAGSNFRYDSR